MTEAINEKFYRDGVYIIENFLTEAECDALKEEARTLVKNMPDQSKRVVLNFTDYRMGNDQYYFDSSEKLFYEEGALGPNGELLVDPSIALNKLAHAVHLENETFRKITFDQRVKNVAKELGLVDPGVIQTMVIFKNPRVGSVVTPHQDAQYLYSEPVNLVGFWIALEDATLENGCLWFLKGSHKNGVFRRFIRNPDKSAKDKMIHDKPNPDYNLSDFTPAPVKKGSCVLIHGQVVHYSEPNKSDKSRHAYTFHIVEQHKTKWADNNWLQVKKPFLSLYKN